MHERRQKSIAQRLGHSYARITLDRYTHCVRESGFDAARKLNGAIKKLVAPTKVEPPLPSTAETKRAANKKL